jgi:hypothetical protein
MSENNPILPMFLCTVTTTIARMALYKNQNANLNLNVSINETIVIMQYSYTSKNIIHPMCKDTTFLIRNVMQLS